MTDVAYNIFGNLNSYSRLLELIDSGEAEGLNLECKSPKEPRMTQEIKAQLAEALSGFGNTEGGVIIWGMSTTKHSHSKLDVLVQIEPIGNCRQLAQQIERAIPTLTIPPITTTKVKTIYESPRDTKGVVITYVPKNMGDPIQSKIDQHFYFRNGDEFSKLPHEMIKRLFAATSIPDLIPIFHGLLVNVEKEGLWKIPIGVTNQSNAAAKNVIVHLTIENPSSCQEIIPESFQDVSNINPGKKAFQIVLSNVVHRGLNTIAGSLKVRMHTHKRAKRVLKLNISIYADEMRAREWSFSVQLAKGGFKVKQIGEEYLY